VIDSALDPEPADPYPLTSGPRAEGGPRGGRISEARWPPSRPVHPEPGARQRGHPDRASARGRLRTPPRRARQLRGVPPLRRRGVAGSAPEEALHDRRAHLAPGGGGAPARPRPAQGGASPSWCMGVRPGTRPSASARASRDQVGGPPILPRDVQEGRSPPTRSSTEEIKPHASASARRTVLGPRRRRLRQGRGLSPRDPPYPFRDRSGGEAATGVAADSTSPT
jgi:hypothetical protein